MNKNINTVVELAEKELECVAGGLKVREAGIVVPGELRPGELRVDGVQFVTSPPAPMGGAVWSFLVRK